jgi:hypothetical protein
MSESSSSRELVGQLRALSRDRLKPFLFGEFEVERIFTFKFHNGDELKQLAPLVMQGLQHGGLFRDLFISVLMLTVDDPKDETLFEELLSACMRSPGIYMLGLTSMVNFSACRKALEFLGQNQTLQQLILEVPLNSDLNFSLAAGLSLNKSLRWLSLRGSNVTTRDFLFLVEIIGQNQYLETLHLERVKIKDKCFHALVEALKQNLVLRNLLLMDCGISGEAIDSFVSLFRQINPVSPLESLHFSCLDFKDHGGKDFVDFLSVSRIRTLHFSRCKKMPSWFRPTNILRVHPRLNHLTFKRVDFSSQKSWNFTTKSKQEELSLFTLTLDDCVGLDADENVFSVLSLCPHLLSIDIQSTSFKCLKLFRSPTFFSTLKCLELTVEKPLPCADCNFGSLSEWLSLPQSNLQIISLGLVEYCDDGSFTKTLEAVQRSSVLTNVRVDFDVDEMSDNDKRLCNSIAESHESLVSFWITTRNEEFTMTLQKSDLNMKLNVEKVKLSLGYLVSRKRGHPLLDSQFTVSMIWRFCCNWDTVITANRCIKFDSHLNAAQHLGKPMSILDFQIYSLKHE